MESNKKLTKKDLNKVGFRSIVNVKSCALAN